MSTDWVDVPVFAALLESPGYPVEDCISALRGYFEAGDGEAGRPIAKMTEALKAHPELLAERLPALLCDPLGQARRAGHHKGQGVEE